MTYLRCVTICFSVFLCFGSEGQDTPGHRPDYPDSLTGVSGLLPGVSGSCCQTIFFSVYHAICITLVFVLTCSPNYKTYKSFCGSLDIYAKIVDMSSQVEIQKFMAYIKGELLYILQWGEQVSAKTSGMHMA